MKNALICASVSMAMTLCSALYLPVTAAAEEITVRIDNFSFSPQVIDARIGDTIVWENGDDIPHSVVSSKSGSIRSQVMDTGDRYAFTVRDEGSLDYFCGLHPHMTGKIVVHKEART